MPKLPTDSWGGPERGARSCPDAESLAAYADGDLNDIQRQRLEQHLNDCGSCYEALSGALDVERVRRTELTLARRRVLMSVSAGALTAAAVLLAVILPRVFTSPPAVRPELAGLVAAVGTARAIEPRVTGGFPYGPIKAPMRSGESILDSSSPDVRIAIATIERRVEESRRPEDVAALGVAYLAVANADKAVAALEESTDLPTPDSNGLSDLAAAYLVRGAQQNQSQDVAKALSAAERAIKANPSLIEASFNRALALERLALGNQAREAWGEYLKQDRGSGWADEARRHVSVLDRLLENHAGRVERQFVDEAARGTDDHVLDDAVGRFPHLARELAEAELLNAWPQAYLAGRNAEAAERLMASRRVGEAIGRATSDRFLQDAVAAVDRTAGPQRAALARAHQAFGEAMRKYEDDARTEATRLFETALAPLEKARSPFAFWTRLQLAIAAFYAADWENASARLEPVVRAAERAEYVRLLGLTLRLRGLLRGKQGQFPEQLQEYRLALRTFERARDPESVAAIHASLAENMDNLGEPGLAWLHRSAALAGLADVQRFRRRQPMLVASATACVQQGLPHAALAFLSAALENARQWNQPIAVAEAYLHRAETHQKLGMQQQAVADLEEAKAWLRKSENDPFAPQVRARIQLAEGEVQQSARPETAASALTDALGFFDKAGLKYAAARGYLARGRAYIAANRFDKAADDFASGIESFEKQRAAVRDEGVRVAYFDQPWDLFTEIIRLKAIHQSQPEAALTYAERSRSRTLLEAVSRKVDAKPVVPSEVRSQLPPAIALVYYAVLNDSVLGWVVQHDKLSFFRRSIRESELTRLIADSQAAHDGSPRGHESLKRLHDELIRPVQSILRSHQTLAIVPDRVLHRLPFAALIDRTTGRYLIQDYAVVITPSMGIFLESARLATPRLDSALVVGNPRLSDPDLRLPDLAAAEDEAREIAGFYQTADLLTGTDATKESFLDRLGRQQVVHFAGHAISNDSYPALSRLLFAARSEASSGSLFAKEIATRDLTSVRVVVLGGCRTSSGLIRRGEGVMSLARPFLAAGATTVLATLWDVNDRTSRLLFVEFHRGLRRGLTPVEALRQAQLRLLESGNPELTSPASWAGVAAIGGIASWRAGETDLARTQ